MSTQMGTHHRSECHFTRIYIHNLSYGELKKQSTCRMKTNLTCSNAKNLKNVETVTSFPSFFLTNAFNKLNLLKLFNNRFYLCHNFLLSYLFQKVCFPQRLPNSLISFTPTKHQKLLYYFTYLFTILILVPHSLYFSCNLLT